MILLEIDTSDDFIKKTHIYANGQITAQHDGNNNDPIYFYLHDRLGSVQQIINTSGGVANRYVFDPFGQTYSMESEETITNLFKFAGQYFDEEIIKYYLRARQCDPDIGRFTSRDPVFGKFPAPLSLHKYLYCLNDPINRW